MTGIESPLLAPTRGDARPALRSRVRRLGRRALRPLAIIGIAVALVAGGVGLDRAGFLPGSPAGVQAAGSPELRLVGQAWDLLHKEAVQRSTLDDTALAYAAIGALAGAVGDPGHTSFETPSQVAFEHGVLGGAYVGIGIELTSGPQGPTIATVYPGSPAARAGIRQGDIVAAVNGVDTTGRSIDSVISLVAGPKSSILTLTVRPAAGGSTRQVTLSRALIHLPVVEWAMAPGTRIADIRIDQFSSGATTALTRALTAAQAAHARGLVLDLRGNPGGLVDEAVGVASQFVGSGDIYQTQDASGTKSAVGVTAGGIALTLPVVVIVDKGTASSAEIVATALHDAGRARIVGETTFGTGTILGQFSLADGSALRIGVVQWLTRDGSSIWHVGLKPDQTVALAAGTDPLGPRDLRGAGATSRDGSPVDAQLRAAIRDVAALLK